MKLFSLQVLLKGEKPKQLQACYDLSSFSFFQRGSFKEFIDFTAKLLCERSSVGERSNVQEQAYFCHIYVRQDNLCGVLFSDSEYPQRVAQTLLTKTLDEFSTEYPSSVWPNMEPGSGSHKKIEEFFEQYKDPNTADSMCRLQNDVQETTEILHRTIETLFERGEKLDDLVYRSEDLSNQSKMFYKSAQKTNRCCTML